MRRETDVKITDFKIEEGKDGIELIYIPSQTQVFREGRRYRFVLDVRKEGGNE